MDDLFKLAFLAAARILYDLYIELIGLLQNNTPSEVIVYKKPDSAARVCVFASYRTQIDDVTVKALKDISHREFYIVLVSNVQISESEKEKISGLVGTIIIRPNKGMDFGAYKAGYNHLLNQDFHGASELLLANDTIIFPLYNSDLFWLSIDKSQNDIQGASMSMFPEHHIQSYFILLKNCVFRSQPCKIFWKEYKVYSARRNVIKKGEIGFSRAMVRAGFTMGASVTPIDTYTRVLSAIKLIEQNNKPYVSFLSRKALDLFYELSSKSSEFNNPSHGVGILFALTGEYPLIKKDIVSRGTVTLHDMALLFNLLENNGYKLTISPNEALNSLTEKKAIKAFSRIEKLASIIKGS